MRWAVVLALVSGCYRPGAEIECSVQCGALGECPSGATCGADLYCHGPGQVRTCGADASVADAPVDSPMDSGPRDALDGGALCPFPGRYFWVNSPLSWRAAQAACRSIQIAGSSTSVHLATISDVAESTTIVNTLAPLGSSWVGLSSLKNEGVFIFVTDEPLTDNLIPWELGQPDNPSVQRCARLLPNAKTLDNDECAEEYSYICECDDWPENLMNFP